MRGISDEMLMAYVDGELHGSDRAAVENYLSNVPGGVERLRIFERTGRGLSDLFDQPMREPVPQRLLDAVKPTAEVVSFDPAKRANWRQEIASWPLALAASLTILAAVGSAYWLSSQSGRAPNGNVGIEVAGNGARIASQAVASVLDTIASGTTAPISVDGQGAAIKPVFTFATAGDGFCRQYLITTHDNTAYGSVACKLPDGSWRVEVQEAFDGPASSDGKIAPASGHAGPKSVEDTVDRLIDGDVLDLEAERAVMARGWRQGLDKK